VTPRLSLLSFLGACLAIAAGFWALTRGGLFWGCVAAVLCLAVLALECYLLVTEDEREPAVRS
jgi:hypothetical protein